MTEETDIRQSVSEAYARAVTKPSKKRAAAPVRHRKVLPPSWPVTAQKNSRPCRPRP